MSTVTVTAIQSSPSKDIAAVMSVPKATGQPAGGSPSAGSALIRRVLVPAQWGAIFQFQLHQPPAHRGRSADLLVGVHACVRASVPASAHACMRACELACARAFVRADARTPRARASVRACGRAGGRAGPCVQAFKGYLLLCQEFCGIFSIDCIQLSHTQDGMV